MAANPAAHPPADDLRAFSLGKLDDATAAAVMTYLENCAPCRQQVASLSGEGSLNLLRQGQSAKPNPFEKLGTLSHLPKGSDRTSAAPFPAAGPLAPELANHPQYAVVRELGRGGMGIVYEARHRLMDRPVAIKVIDKRLLDRPAALERFHREVRAAAKLVHPNIVTAYHAEQAGELLLLIMEYVEGTSLADVVLRRGRLPVAHACHYARQAALGLQHAFEQGMVHRDIKPHNLMLTPKGRVKILDFGLARLASEQVPGVELTQENALMGTPAYMSPEQGADARQADIRADIYSLGCTLYCLLTGDPPFAGGSAMHVIFAHKHLEAKPLHEVRPDVPPELTAVVARMMAKEPGQRYRAPTEVAQALTPFCKPGAKDATRRDSSGQDSTARDPAAAKTPEPSRTGSLTEESVATEPGQGPAASKLPSPAEQAAGRPRWGIVAGIVAGVLLLSLVGLWAAGVFRVKTPHGTIVLENLPADAEVSVDGGMATLKTSDGQTFEIRVAAGKKHWVEVKKEGFKLFGEEVVIDAGDRRPITVRLEPFAPEPAVGPGPSLAIPGAPAAARLAPDKSEWAGIGTRERDGSRQPSAATVTITDRREPAFKAFARIDSVRFVIEGTIHDSGEMTHKVAQVLETASGVPLDNVTGGGEVGKNRMTLLFKNPDTGGTGKFELKRLPDAGAGSDFAGRWKCIHRPSGWSGVRTVHRDGTFLDWNTQKGTWSRDGGLLDLRFAGAVREWLAIDPDNPNELNGVGGNQTVTWSREPPPKQATRPVVPGAGRTAVGNGRGRWRVERDLLMQEARDDDVRLYFGDPGWRDYDFSFEAVKTDGTFGVSALFRARDTKNYLVFDLAGWQNRKYTVECFVDGRHHWVTLDRAGTMAPHRTYHVLVQVRGDHFRCYLDDALIYDVRDGRHDRGAVGFRCWGAAVRLGAIQVKAPDGRVLWEGPPDVPASRG
jgi:serine/threonine protein kinase